MSKRYYKRRRRRQGLGLAEKMVDDLLDFRPRKGRKRSKNHMGLSGYFAAIIVFVVAVGSLGSDGGGLSIDFSEFFSTLFKVLLVVLSLAALVAVVYKIIQKTRNIQLDSLVEDNHPKSNDESLNLSQPEEKIIPIESSSKPPSTQETQTESKYAKVYNDVGSLTELLTKLSNQGIDDFASLDDIQRFRSEYKNKKEEIYKRNSKLLTEVISNFEQNYQDLSAELEEKLQARRLLLSKELTDLEIQLNQLNQSQNLFEKIKRKTIEKRKLSLQESFENKVKKPFENLISKVEYLQSEIEDRKDNTEKWVESLSAKDLKKLELTLSVFVQNKSLFYGAIGEEQVVAELSKLPNGYSVINDLQLHFGKPLYNRRENDYIYSVQVDHVVVGPTGLYLIETKNWSKESVESRDLFSPVKQLQRHSFAMFVLLNQAVKDGEIQAFVNNWGEQKISPQNILALMHHKPEEEFQFVTVLTMGEIIDHISRGKEVFDVKETESLISYLLYIAD